MDYVDNAALGIQSCSISIMQVQNASFKVTILKPELSDPSNSANANGHGIVNLLKRIGYCVSQLCTRWGYHF